MPQRQTISATFFTNLLSRLGVRPAFTEGFTLINEVTPVALVDSDIVLATSQSSIALDLPFTNGPLVAQPANTVLATTGAQAAGNYQVFITVGVDAGGNTPAPFNIVRRNAADSADVWIMHSSVGSGTLVSPSIVFQARVTLLVNERITVRVGGQAIGAGVSAVANIWLVAG